MNNLLPFVRELTETTNCDTIGGVREVPLYSLPVGGRFELVLDAVTPYPHKRIPGTIIRKGPGTIAVVLDYADKERTFQTKEGQTVTLHTSGGIVYWSPGTAVLDKHQVRNVDRWTTKGGTGVGENPKYTQEQEAISAMTKVKEKHAALPFAGAVKGKKEKAKAKRAAAPKELHDCLCGCGERVTGRFRQGHDGRYYSILKKVKSGEMAFNEMPKGMQQALKDKGGVARALAASNH